MTRADMKNGSDLREQENELDKTQGQQLVRVFEPASEWKDRNEESIAERVRRWMLMSDDLEISPSKIAAAELNAGGIDEVERECTVYCYIASEIEREIAERNTGVER